MAQLIKWMTLLTFAVLAGCASQKDAVTAKLEVLEKELMRVKAENANLAARNQALDDRILVYEKKEKSSDKESADKRLEVVRLKPGTEAESRPSEAGYQEISLRRESEGGAESGEARPVLRLSSWGDDTGGVDGGASPARRSISADSIPLTNRGDNLGVVAPGSAPEIAAGEADPAASGGDMANFHMAYRAYSNKNYDAALAAFSTFLKDNSDSEYSDDAMFWRGECYLAQGKMLKAIGEFERLVKRYPQSDQAASALYRLGFVYDKLEDRVRAGEYYFMVVEKHPGTEAARKASRRMSALEAENSQAATVATSARR